MLLVALPFMLLASVPTPAPTPDVVTLEISSAMELSSPTQGDEGIISYTLTNDDGSMTFVLDCADDASHRIYRTLNAEVF